METFFACFRQFYFLTQTEYFAWAIAFALWPYLAIFKMILFFSILAVFVFINVKLFVKTLVACFRQFYFLTQTEYFAWAIAFALWLFFDHFQNALIFSILAFFWSRFFAYNNFNVFSRNVFRMF